MALYEKVLIYVFHTGGDTTTKSPARFIENSWVCGILLRLVHRGDVTLAVVTADLSHNPDVIVSFKNGEKHVFQIDRARFCSAVISVDLEMKECKATEIPKSIDRLLMCKCSFTDAQLFASGNCPCLGNFEKEKALKAIGINKGWSLCPLPSCSTHGHSRPLSQEYKWVAETAEEDACAHRAEGDTMMWEGPAYVNKLISCDKSSTFMKMAVSVGTWGETSTEDFMIPITPIFNGERYKRPLLKAATKVHHLDAGDAEGCPPWKRADFKRPVLRPLHPVHSSYQELSATVNRCQVVNVLNSQPSGSRTDDVEDLASVLNWMYSSTLTPERENNATGYRGKRDDDLFSSDLSQTTTLVQIQAQQERPTVQELPSSTSSRWLAKICTGLRSFSLAEDPSWLPRDICRLLFTRNYY